VRHPGAGSDGAPPDRAAARHLWRRVTDDLADAAHALSLLRSLPGLPPGLHEIVTTTAADLDRIVARLAHHDAAVAGPRPPAADPSGVGRHRAPAPPAAHPERVTLSPREREVLLLIVEGLSNREIANRLGVGSATAKSHVQRLLAKLHAINRTQAAILAVRLGLLDQPP
jgi:DNA-binding NarL/FixJ family response regulator